MNVLGHYTKFDHLEKMLNANSMLSEEPNLFFRANSAFCMDDQMEMNYGYPFIKNVLEEYEKQNHLPSEQCLSSIFNGIPQHISCPNEQYYLSESRTPFVLSFSHNVNSEFMWKKYGEDGKGICLVFDADKIKSLSCQESDTYLFDVAYLSKDCDYTIWQAIVKAIEEKANECKAIIPIIKYKSDIPRFKENILECLCPVISAVIKEGQYSSEEEVRWISIQDGKLAKEWNCKGTIRKYIDIQIPLSYLIGIYFGKNFNHNEELLNLCQRYHILLRQSQI